MIIIYYSILDAAKMDDDLEESNDQRNKNLPTKEEIDEILANYKNSSDESEEYECAADIYRHPSYNGGNLNFYNSGKK